MAEVNIRKIAKERMALYEAFKDDVDFLNELDTEKKLRTQIKSDLDVLRASKQSLMTDITDMQKIRDDEKEKLAAYKKHAKEKIEEVKVACREEAQEATAAHKVLMQTQEDRLKTKTESTTAQITSASTTLKGVQKEVREANMLLKEAKDKMRSFTS